MKNLFGATALGIVFAASSAFAQSGAPIKIGNLLPVTGPTAGTGLSTKAGIEIAFEEANYQAGGRRLELLTEDDQFKADVALTQARKLIDRDGVSILLGPTGTHQCVAISSYVAQKGLTWLPTQCTGKEFSPPKTVAPNAFRPSFQYNQLHSVMASKAFKDLGYKKMVAVGLDYAAGHDETGAFMDAFKALGGQIEAIYMPLGTIDPSPYVTRLASMRVDAVLINLWGADAPRFIKAATDYGLTKRTPFIANGTAVDDADTLVGVGESGIGILNYRSYSAAIQSELNQSFVAKVRAKTGNVPNQYSYTGYVAAKLAIEALNMTKGDTHPAALTSALQNIGIDTPTGKLRFDENHQAILNMYLRKVAKKDGRIENILVDQITNVKAAAREGE